MDYEIIDSPFRRTLQGVRGPFDIERVPVIGKSLMDVLWREVRSHNLQTTGLNHWVYLSSGEMFVGVEVIDGSANQVSALERLEIQLQRYFRYLHRGSYADLPDCWRRLFANIAELDETSRFPNLEIYGHWDADPSKCETTILIELTKATLRPYLA